MAYIQKRKHSSGAFSYRARIRIKGAPEMSETFSSKRKASEWAFRMESEIKAGRYWSPANFLINLLSGLIAYCHQKKKPSLKITQRSLVVCWKPKTQVNKRCWP